MTDEMELAFEIEEKNIVTEEEDRRLCDLCIPECHEIYRFALYLCFTCCKYFCVECFRNHDTNHNIVSKVGEQGEIDRAYARIWTEGDIVEPENVSVCDRVYVKHELDAYSYCAITGLCGADNRRWVACDSHNSCIKIFQCGSNVLLRYLQIGSEPRDVTEIQIKQNSTVPNSVSNSSSDISGTNRTKPDKQCLLAVTLPEKRHILFIDINKNPAVTVKRIRMEKQCYEIEYRDDKIFTVCEKDSRLYGSRWFVYVMSTDGFCLYVIQTGICGWPDLAVIPGRVYLTDSPKYKVKCINVEGRVLSEITMEGLWPYRISVDPDNNVYVSTWHDNNVYKLDLTGPPQQLLDPRTCYMAFCQALCFYKDKHPGSNIVSVVRMV